MWHLPGPGIEPVSSALAGAFLTTGPPGKPSCQLTEDSGELSGHRSRYYYKININTGPEQYHPAELSVLMEILHVVSSNMAATSHHYRGRTAS